MTRFTRFAAAALPALLLAPTLLFLAGCDPGKGEKPELQDPKVKQMYSQPGQGGVQPPPGATGQGK